MSHSFDNPGTWAIGTSVSKGDIFKTTDTHGLRTPPEQIKSDHQIDEEPEMYYRALFSGEITEAHSYSDTASWAASPPPRWEGVGESSISLTSITGGGVQIYANGLHMVPIYVNLIPVNSDDTPLGSGDISDADLKAGIRLIDFNTGEILPLLNTPPSIDNPYTTEGWAYAYKPSEFAPDAIAGGVAFVPTGNVRRVMLWLVSYSRYSGHSPGTPIELGCIIRPRDNPNDGQEIVISTYLGGGSDGNDKKGPSITPIFRAFRDEDIRVHYRFVHNTEGEYFSKSDGQFYAGQYWDGDSPRNPLLGATPVEPMVSEILKLYFVTFTSGKIKKIIPTQTQPVISYLPIRTNLTTGPGIIFYYCSLIDMNASPNNNNHPLIVSGDIGYRYDSVYINFRSVPLQGACFALYQYTLATKRYANMDGGTTVPGYVKLIDDMGNVARIYPNVDYSDSSNPVMGFNCVPHTPAPEDPAVPFRITSPLDGAHIIADGVDAGQYSFTLNFSGTGPAGATVNIVINSLGFAKTQVKPDNTWGGPYHYSVQDTAFVPDVESGTDTHKIVVHLSSTLKEATSHEFLTLYLDRQHVEPPRIQSPENTTTFFYNTPYSISGTGQPGASITLSDGMGNTIVDSLGNWQVDDAYYPNTSSYSLTATQEFNESTIISAPVTVTVNEPLTITSPVNMTEVTMGGGYTVSGTGIPGAVVSLSIPNTSSATVDKAGSWQVADVDFPDVGTYSFTATQLYMGTQSSTDPVMVYPVFAFKIISPIDNEFVNKQQYLNVVGCGHVDYGVTVCVHETGACYDIARTFGHWEINIPMLQDRNRMTIYAMESPLIGPYVQPTTTPYITVNIVDNVSI
ncbi:hypothetical protein QPK13_22330 [Photorhabdus tasmaniensis]